MSKSLEEITQRFSNLLNLIEVIRPGFINAQGNGAKMNVILENILHAHIPNGIVAIYSQVASDSVLFYSLSSDSELIPGYSLIPLSRIKYIQETMIEITKSNISENHWFGDLIPFLENGCGDLYCVRSLKLDNSVYSFLHDEGLFRCNSSLSEFFDLLHSNYESQYYFIDEEGYLETKLGGV